MAGKLLCDRTRSAAHDDSPSNLVGNNFSFVQGIATANSGGMRLANSGTATFASDNTKQIALDGAFLQDGTGPVSIGFAVLASR